MKRLFRSLRTFMVAVGLFLCVRSFFSLWDVIRDDRRHRYARPGVLRSPNHYPGDGGLPEAPHPAPITNSSGQVIQINDTFHRRTTCQNLAAPRRDHVHTRNQWQVYRAPSVEIMLYSAFYDDRPAVGLLPSIRMMVVSSTPKNTEIYCYIWYSDLKQPYVTEAVVRKIGRPDTIQGNKYDQVMLSCALPSSYPVPTHVSVSVTACKPSSVYLPVVHLVRTAWEHEFGICVAISFGKTDIAEFAEWMEFHHLMGVTEVNIYDGDISSEMDKTFEYYENKGWLKVHKMPPAVDEISYKAVKLSSPASLNDCMLRNMYRYRFMVVIDFDEFIVPKQSKNYHEMLEVINKQNNLKEPWMSYTFRNTYFLNEFGEEKSQPSNIHILRFQHRAKPSRPYYAAKSFIDPRRCYSVFNHYCYIRFPNSDKKFSIDVSTDIAASHHYRKCNKNCDKLIEEKTKDDIMMKYKNILVKRVETALAELNAI